MSKRTDDDKAGGAIYKVVVNREGRYYIWPADRENARGWKDAGKTGTKLACERYAAKAEKAEADKRS
jgi:MbtH protein